MKNNKPEFSDKEIYLIEMALSKLKTDMGILALFIDDDLNDIWSKCKQYRLGDRVCKSCDKIIKCENLNEQLICKECQPKVQSKCYHGSYHKEYDDHWHCSFCGLIDDDTGGIY